MYDDENHCANGPELRFEVKLTEYNTQSMARSVAQMISEIVMREHKAAITKMVSEYVQQAVHAELEKAVKPVIENALGIPLVRTDAWGKPVGEPMSVRDIIAKGAEDYLLTKVAHDGKPANPSSYDYSRMGTRLSSLVGEVVDKKFAADMNTAVAGMKKEIQKQMEIAAAAWMAQFQKKALDALGK